MVFDIFIKGYWLEVQIDVLFSVLCSSNGFDVVKLCKINVLLVDQVKGKDYEIFKSWLLFYSFKEGSYYLCLMVVGLMSLFKVVIVDVIGLDIEIIVKQSKEFVEGFGLFIDCVEKDLMLFGFNSE